MDDSKQQDIDMIKRPVQWPRWPLLTVKRRLASEVGGPQGVGVVVVGQQTIVYMVNIYSLKEGTLRSALKDVPCIEYPTVEALTEDWTVD